MLFWATGDTNYNTTAPTGALADSGWQYEGFWGGYSGTAIAPHYFLSARHIGGAVGQLFFFGGGSYTTTAYFDDPGSDLRVWRVCEALPVAAPLYSGSDESGKGLVVIGRGTQRGDPVIVSGVFGTAQKGWFWGPYDGVQRWGQNTVSGIVPANLPLNGPLLAAAFNGNNASNEATFSLGDSGGAVYLQDGSTWKLAGINYGVDGPFNTNTVGAGFMAAIYDEGGLYVQDANQNWTPVPEEAFAAQPANFYATRVSERLSWINSVISVAPAAEPLPTLQAAPAPTGPFADVVNATYDPSHRQITVPLGEAAQFYRVRGCSQSRVSGITVTASAVVLTYQ